MSYNYARLALDLEAGTHFTPNYDDAVQFHRVIDALEASAKSKLTVAIAGADTPKSQA